MPVLWQRIIASKLAVLCAGVAAGTIAAPLLGRAARPLVRELIKAGLIVQKEVLRISASAREELEDLTAEARQELDEHPAHAGHHHDSDPHRAQA